MFSLPDNCAHANVYIPVGSGVIKLYIVMLLIQIHYMCVILETYKVISNLTPFVSTKKLYVQSMA